MKRLRITLLSVLAVLSILGGLLGFASPAEATVSQTWRWNIYGPYYYHHVAVDYHNDLKVHVMNVFKYDYHGNYIQHEIALQTYSFVCFVLADGSYAGSDWIRFVDNTSHHHDNCNVGQPANPYGYTADRVRPQANGYGGIGFIGYRGQPGLGVYAPYDFTTGDLTWGYGVLWQELWGTEGWNGTQLTFTD